MINKNEITTHILHHKQKLIRLQPDLTHSFVEIFIPQWQVALPFLPIRCFRDFHLHLPANEVTAPLKTFLSSGTTGHARAQHSFSPAALKDYALHSCAGFARFLNQQRFPRDVPILSLVPPPAVWNTSSLSCMIDMFSQNHFNIHWCDIEKSPLNILEHLEKIPDKSPCLIFGTTFHHLMLAQESCEKFKQASHAHFKRLQVSIIDTGGTKGRTRAYSLEQIQEILKNFYASPGFTFFSEYGMCELSSQAWSAHSPHDGSFSCNETLLPFSISLTDKCVLPHHQKGFIAFFDKVNNESWPTIITEDMGFTSSENTFHLLGRSPDATIKGCSLNVREHFNFDATSEKIYVEPSFSQHKKIELNDICSVLKSDKKWDTQSIEDFIAIGSSLCEKIPTQNYFFKKDMLIISAANTPIAWLYPYVIACTNGASSVTVKVPSLRLDDPLAQNMGQKTRDLIEIMANYFPDTKTYLDANKSISHTFHQYSTVLTFGSNDTLATISKQVNPATTDFFGKGDIKNSLTVNTSHDAPDYVAKLCSLWNGRGCLTPVALFLEGEQPLVWVQQFEKALALSFLKRMNPMIQGALEGFLHAHNKLTTRAQLKKLNLNDESFIMQSPYTCIVNLYDVDEKTLSEFKPDFSFGGCGFLYIFSAEHKYKYKELDHLSVLPNIQDWTL